MERRYALIGLGEAGSAFAGARDPAVVAAAYDLKPGMQPAYDAARVIGCTSAEDALRDAGTVLSLVTADEAFAAARAYAGYLAPRALWLDMNSVAPGTKRAAAQAVEAAGGRYVDVAIMSPAHPALLDAPLLVSGPHAEAGARALAGFGFTRVRVVGDTIGQASSIKMIRSVMIKGIEALTAECVLAAEAAGVRDEVLASLDATERPQSWAARANYNLDRMMVHGLRRAAEMEEVLKTLEELGTGGDMTCGTILRQRGIGARALAVPKTLDAKLDLILDGKAQAA